MAPKFPPIPKSLPDHVEVTLRICASLILTYVLSLGSFPPAIPTSQRVLLASIASAFTMVMPTLLFSIGAGIFPGMFVMALVALVFSTALLAVAAAGGKEAYVVAFFLMALLFSGLRFSRDQSQQAAALIMFTSLNTMGLQSAAIEGGLPFVRGLWTGPAFQDTLIGILWASLCICSVRLVPPWRTARGLFSGKLLPKVLREVAEFIRLIVAHHAADANDTNGDNDANENDGGSEREEGEDDERIDDAVGTILQDATATINGGVAPLTALEPRLIRICCQCAAPIDLVDRLAALTNAVNNSIISSLALKSFSKGGFIKLCRELPFDSFSSPSEIIAGLRLLYTESAAILDKCADILATSDGDAEDVSTRSSATHEERREGLSMPLIDDGENEEQPLFDPLQVKPRALKVKELTDEFVYAMGPIDRSRSHLNKTARKAYISAVMPWIKGAGVGLVLAILGCVGNFFSVTTWKRIFLPPYYDLPKLVWCLKFAIGFALLVIMEIYWPAYSDLYILPEEEHKSAAFSGWFLIAYAFGTTQTVEGTVKKSILRAIGTAAGGFCGWLALAACGDDAIALGSWMVVTNTYVAYLGLPKGIGSRFGLNKDLAWGPAYFAMTQSLVVLEVYLKYGGRDDITVNRIVSNLVGIAMATLMAVIPPGIYGNSPREAKFLLEDSKRAFRECIRLVLNKSDPQRLNHLYATSKAVFIAGLSEVKENFDDANKLHRLCVLKPNLKMNLAHDAMAVLGSSVLSFIRFGVVLVETDGEIHFGPEEVQMLEEVLCALDIEEDAYNTSAFRVYHCAGEGKDHRRPDTVGDLINDRHVASAHTTFAHLSIYILNRICHGEIELDKIQFGFCGEQQLGHGRRSTLPSGAPIYDAWKSSRQS